MNISGSFGGAVWDAAFLAPAAATATGRVNVPARARTLIANVRNDITIPMFTDVLQPLDDTLIQRGGGKGLKIYDEIMRDAHAYAVLTKRMLELIAREWVVEPASDARRDREIADFVRGELVRIVFDRVCLQLLDATLKGYAVAEIVWMRDAAGRILVERIVDHDQRRFVFDADWRLRLLTRQNMRTGNELPDRKFIVHRVGAKGNNPYGVGVGSQLFWPVLFKREGYAFWMTFLEKYASPTAVAKTPIGMLPAEQREILTSLENLVQRGAITVPIGTELTYLEATRSAPVSYETWSRYWDEQISEAVLGETLSTNIGKVGSLGAASVHTEGKSQIIDADGDLLSDTLQSSLIAWMVAYNFPGADLPRVYRTRPKNEAAIAEAQGKRAKADSDRLTTIKAIVASSAKFVADEEARAWITSFAVVDGLDDKLIDALVRTRKEVAADAVAGALGTRTPRTPPAPGDDGEESEDPDPGFSFAAPDIDLASAHLPEEVLDAFDDALFAPIDKWMLRARASLDTAASLEDASGRALRLVIELSIETLGEQLGDAFVLAELLGRASVVAEAESDGLTTAELFADAGVGADIQFKGAPFAEAIEFLRQKVALPQTEWDTLLHNGHDRAFVVAGNLREDVAADIQGSIIRALSNGTGLTGFRDDFDKLLKSGKWTGDPTLAESEKRRAWRTRTIFMTNMSTAHAAGRLKQQRALKDVLPFWQYRHGATRTPKRPRTAHLRLDGLTLPADDEAWSKIYAPNGWLCSCAVRAITAAAAGRVPENNRTRPDADEIAQAVPEEWRYQPGDHWERGLVPKMMQKPMGAQFDLFPPVDLPPLETLARPLKSEVLADGLPAADYANAFLRQFGTSVGGRAVLYRDAAGQVVTISDDLLRDAGGHLKMKQGRGPHMARLAEAMQDPDEIWVVPEYHDELGEWVLVRRYLRSDPNTQALTSFVWTKTGWEGRTTHQQAGRKGQPRPIGLERQRKGVLLFRRVKEEPAP